MSVAAWEMMSGAWAFASAAALIALAVPLLAGHARPWGAFAFGLFSLTWGAQAAIANVAHFVTDAALAQTLHLLSLALLLPLPYFLIEFANAQAPEARTRPLGAIALTAALAPAAILVASPDLIYRGLTEARGVLHPAWGPLYAPLVVAPVYLAFGAALHLLLGAARRAPTERVAVRLAIPAGGLALFAAFAAANNLAFYLAWWTTAGPLPNTLIFIVLFASLAALLLMHAVVELREARLGVTPAARRRAVWLAAALLLPLAWGAAEGILSVVEFRRLQTVGVWRLAAVALIAFGVARWRIFDLPDRARRASAVALGVAASSAVGAVAYAGIWGVLGGRVLAVVAALVAATAVLPPGLRAGRRLLEVPPEPIARQSRALGGRVEAYRAAIEAALARGTVEADARFLSELQSSLRLSDETAEVVQHFARSSVVVPLGDAATGYERLRLLGEGGQGRTWLARDRAADRLVVLKEPTGALARHRELRAALAREARAAMRVRHPNVVRVERIVESGSNTMLVIEYMPGGSLADILREQGPLPVDLALRAFRDVLAGLEALHAASIVHGDVKPANILLDSEGTAKLSDFGSASLQLGSDRTAVAEGPGDSGTPGYLAPERRRGVRVSTRSDLWEVAASLHEALTGQLPDPDGTVLDSIPEPIRRVLSRALAPDPRDRHASAAELRRALDGVGPS